MSDRFTKVYESILDSSIWFEDSDTRCVWLTMMALADAEGIVSNTLPGLARRAFPSPPIKDAIASTEVALELFSSPDKHSRSEGDEGRRIRKVEGGWFLINHEHYRNKRKVEARREQNREAQQRRRDKAKDGPSARVSTRGHSQQKSAHAEAEAEAEAEEKAVPEKTATTTASPARVAETVPCANVRTSPPDTPAPVPPAPHKGKPTRNEEGVAKVFRTAARGAYQRAGHLTVGMVYPTVAHREVFSVMSANCSELGGEWPDFIAWWFRPGGWAAKNVRIATPKALLTGWQRNVEEWRDPEKFAREQAEAMQRRNNHKEPPQDARLDGDAYREIE